jgi:hypothetical protein
MGRFFSSLLNFQLKRELKISSPNNSYLVRVKFLVDLVDPLWGILIKREIQIQISDPEFKECLT